MLFLVTGHFQAHSVNHSTEVQSYKVDDLGANAMALHINTPGAVLASRVSESLSSAVPLPSQLPTNASQEATDDDSNIWAISTHREDPYGVAGPRF